jgi:uncharacterized membrane protein
MIDDTPTGESNEAPRWNVGATLIAVSSYTVFVAGALLWFDLPTAVRLPLALPVVLFTPGYAVVTALVPETRETAARAPGENGPRQDGFSPLERCTVAVVASAALVPMIALAVNAAIGIEVDLILLGITTLTMAASGIGISRSAGGASTDGASVPDLGDAVPTDSVTLVAVAVAALLVAASAGLLFASDPGQAQMTEFYVVNETDDGTEVAEGYPKSFALGEERPYQLRIDHRGDRPQEYTVVVTLENASGESAMELDRFETVVGPDETARETYFASPPRTGDDLTLKFLLFEGDAPPDPSAETPHRTLEISIEVTEGGE